LWSHSLKKAGHCRASWRARGRSAVTTQTMQG
jgi:hypothetical protein